MQYIAGRPYFITTSMENRCSSNSSSRTRETGRRKKPVYGIQRGVNVINNNIVYTSSDSSFQLERRNRLSFTYRGFILRQPARFGIAERIQVLCSSNVGEDL